MKTDFFGFLVVLYILFPMIQCEQVLILVTPEIFNFTTKNLYKEKNANLTVSDEKQPELLKPVQFDPVIFKKMVNNEKLLDLTAAPTVIKIKIHRTIGKGLNQ